MRPMQQLQRQQQKNVRIAVRKFRWKLPDARIVHLI
jgi:hypothetical protein